MPISMHLANMHYETRFDQLYEDEYTDTDICYINTNGNVMIHDTLSLHVQNDQLKIVHNQIN